MEELIKCSCCGKMVPASELELSFKRPDDIADLSSDEREKRCEHHGDFYILDNKKYFVRCVIPLPVHESADYYAIGAWAEVSEITYQKIWDLWDDEDQDKHEPLDGHLANHVPLTTNSYGCAIAIKLNSTTRPNIIIADENCSLFQEQASGISIHRANEYSDTAGIKTDRFAVVEKAELETDVCSCCGNKIHGYTGSIEKVLAEEDCAKYWLRIPEGHEGYFTIAVSIREGGKPRVVVLVGKATHEGLTYWIQDRADSPWSDFGEYGVILDRGDVLSDRAKGLFFDFVDKIAAGDSRLKAHIEPFLNFVD